MNACRALLGTYIDIRVDSTDRDAMVLAFEAVERVQARMSIFELNSDISRLNQLRAGEVLQVDHWTYEVLSLALGVMQRSEGAFDCGIAHHLARVGLLPVQLRGTASSLAGLMRLGDNKLTVSSPISLDLGGIAKGFAVDKAVEALQLAGVRSGIVNAGGDLRVFGETEEPIYLRDPGYTNQLVLAGSLRDGAVATSATYFSRGMHEGIEVSALVDPRSGNFLKTRSSYSVIAPTCAVADALTKVLALTGDASHPCFEAYSASAVILHPQRIAA